MNYYKQKTAVSRDRSLSDIPALEAGDYALKFKVFAADGHLTEDVIHFSYPHRIRQWRV